MCNICMSMLNGDYKSDKKYKIDEEINTNQIR